MNNSLQSLGLSKHEIAVYMSLINLGPSSPSAIEKDSGLHRPLVYKALNLLINKGVVTISPKGKRKTYVAESPDNLIAIFNKIENKFLSDIEELNILYSSPKHTKPLLTYGIGAKAIRAGIRDIVESQNKGDQYYRYAPGYSLFNKKKYLPNSYANMRDKKQLERFVIANDDGKIHSKKLTKHVKVIPKSFDSFNDRVGVAIYGNKVLIVDYESESAVTINHAKFAEFQKKIFKLLYSKL